MGMCCFLPEHMWEVPAGITRYMLAGEFGAQSRPQPPFPVLGGFASLHFGAEGAVVTLHAHDGTVLHMAPPIPRRRISVAAGGVRLSVHQPGCWWACAAVGPV